MEYSEEKLQQLSLGDLIALKSYLLNDRIKHWSELMEDKEETDAFYQDCNGEFKCAKNLWNWRKASLQIG